MSCVLLKRLSLNTASIYCWSDSIIALYWIKTNKEWKNWVQNCVDIIKEIVKPDKWHYISSSDNPADIATGEYLPNSIVNKKLWQFEPEYLVRNKESWPEDKFVSDVTDELRSNAKPNIAVNVEFINLPKQKIKAIINISKYGSLIKVLKISFHVLKFVNIIYQKTFKKALIKINNIFDGELLSLRDIQYGGIIYDSRFDRWKKSLNLFTDNQGVIGSRSCLTDTEKFEFDQRYPVLLPLSNYFTKLLILYTHGKVCLAGIESTLTELRLKYWIIKGRQTV